MLAGKVINSIMAHIMKFHLLKEILKEGVMKKFLSFLLFAAMIVSLPSSAAALNISPGDKITLGAYNGSIPLAGTGGGEFSMSTDKGVNFISFCLEIGETLVPGQAYVIQTVAPYATGGSGGAIGGQDALSGKTAWLYYMFVTGKLASDFGYVKSNEYKGEDSLQLAIWKLEGEYDGDLGAYSYFYDLALANGWADTDLHGVAVINPIEGSTQKQSILVLTPEPLTLLLLGAGLMCLAGLRRKE
jgi:hypothetical protein